MFSYTARVFTYGGQVPIATIRSSDTGLNLIALLDEDRIITVDPADFYLERVKVDDIEYARMDGLRLRLDGEWILLYQFPPDVEAAMDAKYPVPF